MIRFDVRAKLTARAEREYAFKPSTKRRTFNEIRIGPMLRVVYIGFDRLYRIVSGAI